MKKKSLSFENLKHTCKQYRNNISIVNSKKQTHPQLAIAKAVLSGSMGSGGGGVLLVLTAQNLHPRVQVSPKTIIVAVAIPSPPPFQHSPILGH
jgi:hypothetical protein